MAPSPPPYLYTTPMTDDDHARWLRETYEPAVRRFPERKPSFATESDLDVAPLYGPADAPDNVGFPGEYPFTRGVQPSMYRGRLWTMRQYAGFSSPEDSNARYRFLLSQGQTGLSVAFDLPTQTGYDADHELARAEIGKVGVPISSLADMEALLDGLPLGEITTSMTINSTAPMLLAFYLAVARKQGVPFDRVRGTTQNDVLKEYIARGTHIFPPGASLRLATDMFSFCSTVAPRWNTISISGYHMREAGATAPQELAFTLANGVAYVQAAIDAGLGVDEFAGRLSFFFAAHNNLFEEAAKFRAARRNVGADHARPLRRQGPTVVDAPFPYADGGRNAPSPAARRERRQDNGPSAFGGAGRDAIAARELQGRGARTADRGVRRARAPHPAGPRARVRRRRRHRPACRLLLRRAPHRYDRGRRRRVPPPNR